VISLRQDIYYALRTMRKSPGFTVVAVMTLALGIGANTAIFTLVNAVFFRPIPVRDPASLVSLFTTDEKNRSAVSNLLPVSFPNGDDIQRRSQSFSGMALYATTAVSMTIDGQLENLTAQAVSGDYFDVLGVQAVLGRTFHAADDSQPGASPMIVLNHGLWEHWCVGGAGLFILAGTHGREFAVWRERQLPGSFYGNGVASGAGGTAGQLHSGPTRGIGESYCGITP
jgi:hypothetical protein